MDKQKYTYGFYRDCKAECYKRFGGIFDIPVVDNTYGEIASWYKGGAVLDVGAGQFATLQQMLGIAEQDYFTIDIDEGDFDYHYPEDIPDDKRFDLIVSNQMFEHNDLDTSISFITEISKHLSDSGLLISSVPNPSHPVRFWSDITHTTPWDHTALYTLYKLVGLEIAAIKRTSKVPPSNIWQRLVARTMANLYRVDWCDTIIVIGQRSA